MDPVLRVDWRPLVAAIVRALRGEEEHMLGPAHEQYRTNLVACLGAMRVFIPASEGPELIAAIWAHADPVRADVVIISQVLCFVLPAEECIRAIADGDLWEWWGTLEEKRCSRFDLLWFSVIARALKHRWAFGCACEEKFAASLRERLPA